MCSHCTAAAVLSRWLAALENEGNRKRAEEEEEEEEEDKLHNRLVFCVSRKTVRRAWINNYRAS
jgi:hypothetical protein